MLTPAGRWPGWLAQRFSRRLVTEGLAGTKLIPCLRLLHGLDPDGDAADA